MSTTGQCARRYLSGSSRSSRLRDYEYAKAKIPRHVDGEYKTATHFAEVIAKRGRYVRQRDLAEEFKLQVEIWKNNTGHLSSITKAVAHPAYLRIIGLARNSSGHEIETLLLNELESDPDHWFAALTAVTGEDPVRPEHDFDGAVNAWLEWGRNAGILNEKSNA